MYGPLCRDAIDAALALPHGKLPSYPRTRSPKKSAQTLERIKVLKKMREKLSVSLGMEPGFLINNHLITAIALKNPRTLADLDGVDNLRNWQKQALGETILKTLGGNR
jgi:ribonuclease D